MKARHSGFTLIELAIALLVVAILTAGGLRIIQTLTDLNRSTETRDRMARVRDALTGYFVRNGRLPCPALPSLADGAPLSGSEVPLTAPIPPDQAGVCQGIPPVKEGGHTAYVGSIPWATLGLTNEAAYDSYNGRIDYMVSEGALYNANLDAVVSPNTPAPGSDILIPTSAKITGSIRIYNAGNLVGTDPATGQAGSYYAFALLSHGPNGLGAVQSSGIRKPFANMGAGVSEGDKNANPQAPEWREAPEPIEANAAAFDDRLVYVSADELINKAIAAGTIPSAQSFFNAQVGRFKQSLLQSIQRYNGTLSFPASHFATDGMTWSTASLLDVNFSPLRDASGDYISALVICNKLNVAARECEPPLSEMPLDLSFIIVKLKSPDAGSTCPSATGFCAYITVGDIYALANSAGLLQPKLTQSSP